MTTADPSFNDPLGMPPSDHSPPSAFSYDLPSVEGRTNRDVLYAEFKPLERRLIRQYGGDDPEFRQDLAGEIYCRFCTLLDEYDPSRGVPLKPYLVRQLSVSIYTYARHRWRTERRELHLEVDVEGAGAMRTEDPTPQWDDRLLTTQVMKSLPEAIGRLPKRQRQVVIWRYYEDRTFEEIAAKLIIQPATARSLLRHGLNALRRWVQERQLDSR